MNNTIYRNTYIFLCGIFLSVILLEGSFKELFHNHEPDFREHENCPVLILNQVLSSGITFHFEFPTEFFAELSYDKPQSLSASELTLSRFYLRSPPLN